MQIDDFYDGHYLRHQSGRSKMRNSFGLFISLATKLPISSLKSVIMVFDELSLRLWSLYCSVTELFFRLAGTKFTFVRPQVNPQEISN